MTVYRIAKTSNPHYLIEINCPGHGFGVQVDMPEQLALAVSSEWESRLPHSIADIWSKLSPTGGGLGTAISNILGSNPNIKSLSYQMWAGTTPIEIPLTVLFDAERSALMEVYDPIVKLQSLVLPVDGTLAKAPVMYPPGPSVGLFSNDSGGYGVNIRLGRMMIFMNCIIVSANAIYDSRLDDRGYPISGQLELVFRTAYVYSRADWLRSTVTGPDR